MASFSDILGKVRKILGGRPKAPVVKPTVGMGHRGVAAGDLAERQRRRDEGESDFTAEEIREWETVPSNETTAFVYEGREMPVHSSNVASAQYLIDDQTLILTFKNGSAYAYLGVTKALAIEFVQAMSKGGFCWDRLRVRGTKNGHQKPFIRLR